MSLLLESGHFDSWATGNMPGFRLLKIKVKFLFNKVELHSTLKQSYFVSGRFQLYPHISRKKPRNTLVLIQKSIRIHVTERCRSLRILGSVTIIGGRLMQVSTVFYTSSLCLVYNRATVAYLAFVRQINETNNDNNNNELYSQVHCVSLNAHNKMAAVIKSIQSNIIKMKLT